MLNSENNTGIYFFQLRLFIQRITRIEMIQCLLIKYSLISVRPAYTKFEKMKMRFNVEYSISE